jgi:predicted Zn-dependent peptidase
MRIALSIGAALGVGMTTGLVESAAKPEGLPSVEVVKHTLQNGMRLLMVERHDSPTVATHLRFNVGGVDDPKGQTGIAHLLEHMMFKGTRTFGTTNHEAELSLMERLDRLYAELDAENAKRRDPFGKPDLERIRALEREIDSVTAQHKKYIVKDELWQTYQRLGGERLNASTGDDSTQYYVTLPSNQLEVWAYLEADRIANPVFREFYSERDVVHEERRLRTDTQPQSLFREAFQATAFIAHPYRNPVVGWPTDIDSTVRSEVLQFFKMYYAPNNCIAVLVGDLDPKRTIALVEKYFGPIPAQPEPRRTVTDEPEHRVERRLEMTADAAPQVMIAYPLPPAGAADSYPLRVAARILSSGGFGGFRGGRGGGGGSGRLFKRLVLEKQVALNAFAFARARRYASHFSLTASPAHGRTPDELLAALTEEVERLKTEPATDEELGRIRNAIDAESVRRLQSNTGLAAAIAEAEGIAGDWRYLFDERDRLKAVTAADVQEAAARWLVTQRRTVGILRSEKEQGPPRPAAQDEEQGQ